MTKLSINLNKVALLRNQRDVGYPSVLDAARRVIAAGAHGITVHPRPDQRHTRPSDVRELRALLRDELGDRVELNIEGNPTEDFLALVNEVVPAQATLVPDEPGQRTSDHGWDVRADGARLEPIIAGLKARGIRVSLFMDPDPDAMALARRTGTDRIELYTEPYARAYAAGDYAATLARYVEAAQAAVEHGLGVNAGHDLNLDNLPTFKRNVPALAEVSIGHAFTADALVLGYAGAVRAYLAALAPMNPDQTGADAAPAAHREADMERVRQKLAELTSREVQLTNGERAYEFKLDHVSEPAHWLYVSHELVEKHGEQGVLDRLDEVVPHLTTVGQSLRVTLTSNRVRAEPAAD